MYKPKQLNIFVIFILISCLIFSPSLYALPQGEEVISGSAFFDRSQANILNINTPSDKLIVNYRSFSIGSIETVRFSQPSSSSAALNRITGQDPSSILGRLSSNGKIFLVNPNGILFGKNCRLDTAGLTASTLNISNEDFLKGNYSFFKDKNGYILNQGELNAGNNGYVCLLSSAIENSGIIQANLGTVVLATGEKMTLSLDHLNEISVVVDEPVKEAIFGLDGQKIDSSIKNAGSIIAQGGKVILTAKVLNNVFDHAINNTGIIEAKSLVSQKGVIELKAQDAEIINTGKIAASEIKAIVKDSDFTNKGSITADTLVLFASGIISSLNYLQCKTLIEKGYSLILDGTTQIGHAFIDNLDNAVNISGNISGIYSDLVNINFIGSVNLIGNTTLNADSDANQTGKIIMNGYSLTGNNYNLALYTGENTTLDGNITGVNLFELYSSTLNDKTFTSTSPNFSANTLKTNYHSNFSRNEISGGYQLIFSASNVIGGLQYMQNNLSGLYKLANNIDVSETQNWNAGLGFAPVGNNTTPYTGTFNGNNKTISGLYINRPATDYVGLFGYTGSGGSISNIGLTNTNITGKNYVGGLIGRNNGIVFNSYSIGNVSGSRLVGGLAGYNSTTGTVTNSYSINNNILGSIDSTGGLIGYNDGTISNSYSTGNVSGSDYVGGLVGYNRFGTIFNSYSNSNVLSTGYGFVGGLTGFNDNMISNSYSTGNVSGNHAVAGLVGVNYANITNCYSIGSVLGNTTVGGLVGAYNSGIITNSYYDQNTSGQSDTGKGVPKTTSQMMNQSTFSGWDFTSAWATIENKTYPYLQWQYPGIRGAVYQNKGITSMGSGAAVSVAINGTVIDTVLTDASGIFYSSLSAGQFSNGDAILVYLDNNTIQANTTTIASTGTAVGLNIYGNTLIGCHENAGPITNSTFSTAKGALTDADILYSLSGVDLALNSGIDFLIWQNKTYTPGGNLTTDDLVIQSGAVYNAQNNNTTVSGDWLNNGTFNYGTGTVAFNAAKTSNIFGSNTFNNLICQTAEKQLNFESNSTQTIQGALTLTGAAGEPLKLRSFQEGSQWKIAPLGSREVKYADIKDSNNISNPVNTLNSVDSGNNTNWSFLDKVIANQIGTVVNTQTPVMPKEEIQAPEIKFSEEFKAEQKQASQKESELKQERKTEKKQIDEEIKEFKQKEETQTKPKEKAEDKKEEFSNQKVKEENKDTEESKTKTKEEINEKKEEKQESKKEDAKEEKQESKETQNTARLIMPVSRQNYLPGKYNTVVILFEGRVIVTPHIKEMAQVVLTPGKTIGFKNEIGPQAQQKLSLPATSSKIAQPQAPMIFAKNIFPSNSSARDVIFTQINGDVFVKSKNGRMNKADDNMILGEDDEIITKNNGSAKVVVDSVKNQNVVSGSAEIEIHKDSQLKFASLKQKGGAVQTTLDLAVGDILVNVRKLRDKDSRFQVTTPTCVTAVRGTSFEVKVTRE